MLFRGWKEIINFGVGVTLLTLIGFLSFQLMRQDAMWIPSGAEAMRPVDARTYRILTFGHWQTALDWLTVRFLVEDPSYSHVSPGSHPPAFALLDLATDLDPAYRDLYTTGANYLAVVRSDARGALHLLKKAELYRTQPVRDVSWDAEWYILMLIGYVYLYEQNDLIQGAEAFRQAGALPGAPRFLQEMSRRLSSPGGVHEVGINLVKMMMLTEKNEQTYKKLESKLHSLQVGHYLALLNLRRGDQGFILPEKDPWGGKLSRTLDGTIETQTPRESVWGLE